MNKEEDSWALHWQLLELDHGTRTRRRAHEFCFNMTDLSPRDDSPKFFGEGIEDLPVDCAGGAGELVGGEDQGYFDPDSLPWRNYGIDNDNRDGDSNEGQNETSEGEQEPGESEDTRVARYLHSRLEDVFDPEMWMGLHHWSSEDESGEEATNDGTAAVGNSNINNEAPENEPRTDVE